MASVAPTRAANRGHKPAPPSIVSPRHRDADVKGVQIPCGGRASGLAPSRLACRRGRWDDDGPVPLIGMFTGGGDTRASRSPQPPPAAEPRRRPHPTRIEAPRGRRPRPLYSPAGTSPRCRPVQNPITATWRMAFMRRVPSRAAATLAHPRPLLQRRQSCMNPLPTHQSHGSEARRATWCTHIPVVSVKRTSPGHRREGLIGAITEHASPRRNRLFLGRISAGPSHVEGHQPGHAEDCHISRELCLPNRIKGRSPELGG